MSPVVNFLNPTFSILPKAAGRRQPAYQLPEEEKQSLLKSIGGGLLSGLATVGAAIDLPWSMGRDVLAGENPFDQLLSPLSFENRTSGRGLLEKWGVLGPNKPGFDWGDVAGVGVEIADPILGPLAFASKALKPAGEAAKAAGLLEDVAKVATDTLGKGTVGWRQARMLLTPKKLLETIKDPAERAIKRGAFDEAAAGLGKAGTELLDQPLGGLLGWGIPFRRPAAVLGKPGGIAEKVAKGLDIAGQGIRHGKYSPIRPLADLFSVAGWSARTPEGFEALNWALRQREAGIATAKGAGNQLQDLMMRAGLDTDKSVGRFREVVENIPGVARTPAEDELYQFVRPLLDNVREDMQRYGLPHAKLEDAAEYMHRQMTRRIKSKTGYKLYPTTGAEDLAREPIWKGWQGGTADIQRAARAVEPIVRQGGGLPAVEAELKRLASLPKAQGGITNIPDLSKVAKALNDMDPDTLASGLFGNYGVFDFESGLAQEMDKLVSARTVVRTLGRPGMLKATSKIAAEESIGLGKLVENLNLHHPILDQAGKKIGESQFYTRLAEEMGIIKPGQALPDAIANAMKAEYRVEKTLADDLGRVMESFGKTPQAMKEPLAFYDSLQNVWKALQTGPWPAFQMRNRLSGWVQEALAGRAAFKYQGAMRALIRGESSAVWKEHPLVKKLATEWGKDATKLTNQEASDLARSLLRQYGVVAPYQGEALQRVGQAGAATATGAEDFMRQFVGQGLGGKYQGLTGAKIAQQYGKSPFGSIRGAFGAQESTAGFVKGGEMWGARVEAMNRGPGFFSLTAKGVDPVEAARQVGLAQVRYENRFYTPFEQAMLRVFPFGKFLRGQTEYVAKELLGRPAGPLGTTIRATARARGEDIAPEYVQQTASVPIPEGTPLVGPQKGGDLRYLTGFGLMHEDPLQLLGGGVRGSLAELLSRASPAIKGPVEWAAGRSFFQRGPEGGRELTEMDPTLGRIGRNVQQLASGERGRAEAYKLPLWLEQLSANSPISRLATTIRTLSDPRKAISEDVPIPGPAAGLNLLTGARVVDVPEAAQEGILREAVTQRLRGTGLARVFERTYVPKETIEGLPPEQQKEALQLQALLNLLAERASKRAKGESLGPIGSNALTPRSHARSW